MKLLRLLILLFVLMAGCATEPPRRDPDYEGIRSRARSMDRTMDREERSSER